MCVGRDAVFIYVEACCAALCHVASEHPAVWWWWAGGGVSPGRCELVRRRAQESLSARKFATARWCVKHERRAKAVSLPQVTFHFHHGGGIRRLCQRLIMEPSELAISLVSFNSKSPC